VKRPEIDSETERLKALIAEGIASGVCDKEPEAIIEEIIAKRRARNDERDILCK
jgi:hypothetical protein